MKKRMVALALATVMVLAAFVPLMGMVNADNDQSVGEEELYNVHHLPVIPGRIGIEAKWSGYDWTNRSYKAEAEYGIELWEVSKPGMISTYTFCAELGSPDIDHAGYINTPDERIDADMKLQIMAALDYVYDKYGGFTWGYPLAYIDYDGTPVFQRVTDPELFSYAIAQMAIWTIIETPNGLEAIRGSTYIEGYWNVFDDVLQDVLNNSMPAYQAKMNAKVPGQGYVKDIVFLGPAVWRDGQHQLFPLFDKFKETKNGDGSLIIGKEMGKKASYGSVTGGYASEAVPNAKGKYDHSTYVHNLDTALKTKGNWFQFNDFNANNGVATFDLVTGDKLKKVGEYDIVSNGDGTFTVTLRPNDALVASGAKISISNAITPAKNKNDFAKLKNVAQNPIWTSAPGQQQFAFSADSYTFSAPWVDLSKPIFVYIHLSLNGYEDTSGVGAGQTWTFEVTGDDYYELVTVTTNGFKKLENLAAGVYTIKELAPGWEASYSLNGAAFVTVNEFKVTVVDFKTQTVNVKNVPAPVKAGFAVKKMVETHDGFVPAADFTFAAYAAIDIDGNPIGSPIATATSVSNGFAYFGPSNDFVIGNWYYVFEEMTADQEIEYHFGLQGAYVMVQAVDVSNGYGVAEIFENNQNHGGIFLSMSYQVITLKQISEGTVAGGDLTSDRIVQGAWQRAKMIDVDAILGGEPFTANLVTGFNLTVCGTYTISADGIGGLLVELNYYPGIRANSETMVAFGNGNDGKTQSDISGNNPAGLYKGTVGGSIVIPYWDVQNAKVNNGGLQYFYLHSGTRGGTAEIDITDTYALLEKFWFSEEDFDCCERCSCTFPLDSEHDYEFDFVCEPGVYTLHCLTGGWTYTCICDEGPVCVAEGFVCSIEPGETHIIEIIAKKIV